MKMHSRKKPTGDEVEKRIVVIDHDKVKPNSEAFRYLKRNAGSCGRNCIHIEQKTVTVHEWACPVCVNKCKLCPGDAISVVKLPMNLTTDTTHRYGPNSFKLHGLPIPKPGHVLGLLGANGTGKSTAVKILAGYIKPNLGDLDDKPEWADIVSYYRGSDLQVYFTHILQDKLTVSIKPQLEANFTGRLKGKTVRALMEKRNERKMLDRYARQLDLEHLLDRNIEDLSGGELQRFAVACTFNRDADVYMFDEVTSFLDIKQRLKVTELMRSLVHDGDLEWPDDEMASSKKYVITIEHDLAILDYMSDYVQCLYGSPGAYGVVTSRSRVRNGINQFLAGYITSDNMRFRDHELTFKVKTSDFIAHDDEAGEDKFSKGDDGKPGRKGVLNYPAMQHTRQRKDKKTGEVTTSFTLHVEAGSFRDGECIVLLGENGTGKTTFMELLAGNTKEQRSKESTDIGSYQANEPGAKPSLAGLGVSYKTQGLNPKLRKFRGTVQDCLEQFINPSLADRLFRLLVMKPLSIDTMAELPVASLSGGEMQRLSIVLCLGTPANVYLIDEPSAALDCEQRVIAAKVMKRWVVNHLNRAIFLVEHDFVMAAAMADRVIVYEGKPGIECTAKTPYSVAEGFNTFLKSLDVTFRRDPINFRPRINKKNSRVDRAQKSAGEYFLFDVNDEADEEFEDI
mmetsp:Transcript_42042/g.75794  ORF Transcript_42042/g.75794 Transcript_42042/m.75794 type:complete len:680 (+) Transcript_42042:227-2266(+)|eukprot:CAMPEP_0201937718 /NCGR_PEP_ID=MMETSP0903-20130614/40040_1 /ASSEMBLY_ACC=CAM_ASM_000552 /TAXON_ID=420261 /ORGANISM="Thalassiosira antarctica, Strain CCMP982" /LENGTH=679 /DNA_ID=CAMNT_0048478781 /DNA_START=215 /DNA_END=2254 /DNA_ORIENTATION=+